MRAMSLRLRTTEGQPFNVSIDVDMTEVTALGDNLPRDVLAGVRREIAVRTFADLCRAVSALNPSITEDDLRRLVRERTVDLAGAITR